MGNRLVLAISILAVFIGGCGGISATSSSAPVPTIVPTATAGAPTFSAEPSAQSSETGWYVGTLVWAMSCPGIKPDGADPWPNNTTKIHELVLPSGYQVQGSNPFHLLGPDGSVIATEGDAIQVAGTIPSVVASFCSIGPIIKVTDLRKAPTD